MGYLLLLVFIVGWIWVISIYLKSKSKKEDHYTSEREDARKAGGNIPEQKSQPRNEEDKWTKFILFGALPLLVILVGMCTRNKKSRSDYAEYEPSYRSRPRSRR